MRIKEFELREEMYHEMIPKNKVGAELGVCRGINAVQLYFASKPQKMYLVDLWHNNKQAKSNRVLEFQPNNYYDQVKNMFSKEVKENKVVIKRTDSIEWLSSLKDDSLDWVYLDSLHYYDHIKKEISLSLDKIKSGGLIMGHDFHSGDAQRTGVIRAVIEAIHGRKIEMIAISSERWASYVCKVL